MTGLSSSFLASSSLLLSSEPEDEDRDLESSSEAEFITFCSDYFFSSSSSDTEASDCGFLPDSLFSEFLENALERMPVLELWLFSSIELDFLPKLVLSTFSFFLSLTGSWRLDFFSSYWTLKFEDTPFLLARSADGKWLPISSIGPDFDSHMAFLISFVSFS